MLKYNESKGYLIKYWNVVSCLIYVCFVFCLTISLKPTMVKSEKLKQKNITMLQLKYLKISKRDRIFLFTLNKTYLNYFLIFFVQRFLFYIGFKLFVLFKKLNIFSLHSSFSSYVTFSFRLANLFFAIFFF